MGTRISPEWLQAQVRAYASLFPNYERYAQALRRVLERAVRAAFPEAVVQARAKSVSSFAEKAARKWEKYPDPVNQLTDLCGGRVIVQTLSQVESVRQFVDTNFAIVETEDIGRRLGDQEFGYRDRHYIIRLDPAKARSIGFSDDEIVAIGECRAELQVRTWVQHAWADALHDRTYKTTLRLTSEARRTGALLAALMEDGDRNFDRLVNELDGLAGSYASYASRSDLRKEADTLAVLLENEPAPDQKPGLALKLARLQAALGDHAAVVELLRPYAAVDTPRSSEIMLELGTALCRLHRQRPGAREYLEGRDWIRQVTARCASPDLTAVRDRGRLEGLRGRALSRLGWAWEIEEIHAAQARECYRQALEHEPGNPYYLADALAFELRVDPGSTIAATLRPVIRGAIRSCEAHVEAGLELPHAHFTAGRLRLLLGEEAPALADYLRGARHILEREGVCGCEVLEAEVAWLHRVNLGRELPESFRWVRDFLRLAHEARDCEDQPGRPLPDLPDARAGVVAPVLILAGGAGRASPAMLARVREPLLALLEELSGTVISGGTTVGVPGLAGELTASLGPFAPGGRSFRLLGYRPERLPDDATRDDRYDEAIAIGGSQFSVEQVFGYWVDILNGGHRPSDVRLLAIGGGALSALEYRVALALGASVGVVLETGGEADALLKDPHWNRSRNLLPLPLDPATFRAFIHPSEPATEIDPAALERMAREFHATYVASNPKQLPETMQPWELLSESYRIANLEQARYAIDILRAAKFLVRRAQGVPDASIQFTDAEVERMAELEHGRWNIERLRRGWRTGPRNDAARLHDCLVGWTALSDGPQGVKRFDRQAVRAFPRILALGGWEIVRA